MKKILLMLALMLPCLGAWAQIQPSTKTDAPENLYKIKTKTGYYMAAHSNPTQENYGRFAFYAVDGKENTYKVYSYDANLWLSYTKASGYNNGMNFVSFAQTQESANEWYVTKANNGYYQVAPYNTTGVASKYWNFFGGINSTYYSLDDYRNTLGLYQNNATSDDGSAWTLEAVAADDYTAPTTLNYELTDGNGNVYTGTYTGVAGRTRLFTHQNTLCPIKYVTWDGNTYKANIAIPFHTSGVVISTFYNDNIIRLSAKEGKEIATKTVPTVETINDYLWNIHPSFANNTLTFSIQHVATNKFLYTTATSRAHDDATITLEDEGTQFVYVANNGFKYGNLWLSTNSRNSNEQCMGMWDSQHDGAKHLIHKVNNFAITDTVGNVHEGEFNGYGLKNEAFLPEFTGVEGYTLSNQSWDGYTFKATINYNLPFTVSSDTTTNLITIGQGTWANAEDGAHTKLWTVVDGNVKVVNGIPALGTAQWMVYPTLNGTKFEFKIKSASTGKFVTANLASGNDEKANNTPVTLTDEGTKFSFIGTTCGSDKGFAYTNNNDVTMYLTRNGEKDNNALLGVYQASNNHKGSGLRFPEFNQYKVVIGDVGYTTVYSPFTALTNDPQYNPENYTNGNFVEIYTIASKAKFNEEMNEWKVPLVQASYYVPSNGAAILKGKGTYVFTKADDDIYRDDEIEAIWANNNLKGSSVNTYVAEDAYMLSAPEGVESIGLYPILLNKNAEGATGNTHFLNNAGKAYILAEDLGYPTTPGTTATIRFSFGGETTAIEPVINNGAEANAPIYDLSGRRVVNAVKGGIYIQNGKKVYIK